MPDDVLPRIPPAMITAFLGDRTASRGFADARAGRVTDLAWDADTGTLRGEVEEDSGTVRTVAVQLQELGEDAVSRRFWPQEPGGVWRPENSACDCEERSHCRHAAALLYAADRRREQQQIDRPVPEWRTVLRSLLTEKEAEDEPAPLAIRFTLHPAAADGAPSASRSPATAEQIRAGGPLRLALSPLRRGAQGGWARGGLSWRSFEYRMPGRELNPTHAEALTRVVAAAGVERSYASGALPQLWLDTLGSPLVWQALAHARDVGVALLGASPLSQVHLGDRAEVDLDLSRTSTGALRVLPRFRIDGTDAPGAAPMGSAGVMLLGGAGRGGEEALLAPLGAPLPSGLRRLLARPEPLEVATAEIDDFLRTAYPRLRTLLPVTSQDESIELPRTQPATLQLRAEYAPGDRLTLRWSWRYHDPDRTLPMDRSRGARRDVEHEDQVLAEVRTLWPTAGGEEPEHLGDTDTARFSQHVLDALGELDHVRTRIVGTRHAYRELDGAPQIRVTQVESKDRNDWFDLGFQITVDGHDVPFSSLFTALARGRTKLLMVDHTYLSLEHPAFDTLRALIAEGEALAEWEPDHQAISRFQLDLWDDLTVIAEEAQEAATWRSRVQSLRDLRDPAALPLPSGLTADLRPYQREGFSWLAALHEHGLGGILADDMGLGKTLQTLALIAHVREQAASDDPFLVVAPTSVLGVWREEAARFTPDLDVRVLDRTSRARGRGPAGLALGADIIVTSYAVLRIDEEEFARVPFAGLILDEAQFVKNRRSRTHQAARRVQARFRLAITGTPMENSLDDLWSILSLATPGLLGPAIGFRQRFTLPIASGEHPERLDLLRRRVRPFVLRRTKEQVASELPPKDEVVVRIPLEAEHRALYDSILQRERKKVLGLIESDAERSRFIVFRSLTLLRMLALDPRIVDPEEYRDVPSSKLDALMDRLDEVLAADHRVLMFSQFTSFLHRVAEQFEERGISYAYLDGSTRDREGAVAEFREGGASVFLVSLKAGGFGLTLTEADYVVLLDPWWNPAAENQAIDRAHRIGQHRHVMVVKMVAEDTIEEKVLALQERKAALFDALTEGGEAFRRGMTTDDVRELLAQ